jgi:hypothetical protein
VTENVPTQEKPLNQLKETKPVGVPNTEALQQKEVVNEHYTPTKQEINKESHVDVINRQLSIQVSTQQQEINLQPSGKWLNLLVMLMKPDLPNNIGDQQLLCS